MCSTLQLLVSSLRVYEHSSRDSQLFLQLSKVLFGDLIFQKGFDKVEYQQKPFALLQGSKMWGGSVPEINQNSNSIEQNQHCFTWREVCIQSWILNKPRPISHISESFGVNWPMLNALLLQRAAASAELLGYLHAALQSAL